MGEREGGGGKRVLVMLGQCRFARMDLICEEFSKR